MLFRDLSICVIFHDSFGIGSLVLNHIWIYPYSVAPMIQFHLVDRLIDLGDKVGVKSEDICQMCQNQGGKL